MRYRSVIALLSLVLLLGAAVPAAAAAPSDCNGLGEYESQDEYQDCLRNNTTADNVTDYVHTNPENLSQKQIDAVYAISPSHDDEYGFNETQKQHITDWMTWEKAGLQPNWYNESSADESDDEPDGPISRDAQIAVTQPEYLGSTGTVSENGKTVHVVDGREVEVQPQNFESDDVIGFGVSEGPGDLSYDNQMDEYVFSSQGEVGTFQLYWEVEEEVRTENGTRTARTRYTATIRAESNQTYQHIPEGELSEQQSNAKNWSAWEAALVQIYGEDVNVQDKTQKAEGLLRLANNPFAALSGDFTGILMMMFLTLGGMVLLALIGLLHLTARWTDIKYINRIHSLKPEERDIDERLSDLDWREKMRSVAKWDWNDWFGDYTSRAYRRIASTPFKGMKKLLSVRRPRNLVEHRVQAMATDDYVGVVERDEYATDGGSGDAVGPITDASLVRKEYAGEDVETVDISDPSDEFIDALDWDSETLWNYSLADSNAKPEDINVEQAPISLEELVDELGTETRDFQSRQHWGKYLLEFVEFVRDHEFCDEDGRPDDIQFVLNEWMDTDDVLADAFDLPHWKAESEALEWAVKHSDPVEQADARVNAVMEGRDVGTDD